MHHPGTAGLHSHDLPPAGLNGQRFIAQHGGDFSAPGAAAGVRIKISLVGVHADHPVPFPEEARDLSLVVELRPQPLGVGHQGINVLEHINVTALRDQQRVGQVVCHIGLVFVELLVVQHLQVEALGNVLPQHALLHQVILQLVLDDLQGAYIILQANVPLQLLGQLREKDLAAKEEFQMIPRLFGKPGQQTAGGAAGSHAGVLFLQNRHLFPCPGQKIRAGRPHGACPNHNHIAFIHRCPPQERPSDLPGGPAP